jgi:hypothetical protein
LTAVFDEFQGNGAATFAAEETEKILIEEGVQKYYAQVNGNQAATGLRVRRRLLARGFAIVEKSDVFGRLNDDDYVRRYPGPVVFEKRLGGEKAAS